MSIARVDGILLSKMLENGLNNLRLHETEINRLNVFPVADGDTGTNMRLTLENGLRHAAPVPAVGAYLHALGNGMLLGARGNSGVILSQFFKGVACELARYSVIGAAGLRNAFIRGYRTAYESVMRPVEGTILTVTREGIENIRRQVARNTSVDTFLSMYIAEMKKSLSFTPEMLDVLKSAGVVDSGASGYILIIEGMLKFIGGDVLRSELPALPATQPENEPDYDAFGEYTAFEDGYCTEFLLRLMKLPGYAQPFRMEHFIDTLGTLGNSIVAVQDDSRVKVHIHTKNPERVISLARKYGEFLTFKLENMQLQHNEHMTKPAEESKPLAIIAVCDGEGVGELFRSLGCDVIIDGGATMNPPAFEFVNAFDDLHADRIVVLPNNSNTIGAANQARSLYTGSAVIDVLPSSSIIEAYLALAMDVGDSDDTDFRVRQMENGISGTHSLAVAFASKEYSADGLTVHTGDTLAVIDGNIAEVTHGTTDAVLAGLRRLPGLDGKDILIAIRGADTSDEDTEALREAIEKEYPSLELNIIDGGQHVYLWQLGAI